MMSNSLVSWDCFENTWLVVDGSKQFIVIYCQKKPNFLRNTLIQINFKQITTNSKTEIVYFETSNISKFKMAICQREVEEAFVSSCEIHFISCLLGALPQDNSWN